MFVVYINVNKHNLTVKRHRIQLYKKTLREKSNILEYSDTRVIIDSQPNRSEEYWDTSTSSTTQPRWANSPTARRRSENKHTQTISTLITVIYDVACVCVFTIMNTKLMVMKMLAMATTVWSAEMASVMDVAVYDTRMMEKRKMKNASAAAFSPVERSHRCQVCMLCSCKWSVCVCVCVWPIIQYATQLKIMAGMVLRVMMSERILDRK